MNQAPATIPTTATPGTPAGTLRIAEPFQIGRLSIPNRLVMTPMGTDLANADGTVSPALLQYWLERARGGCGLIISEITRVNDVHGAGTPKQLSLTRDDHVEGLADAVRQIHDAGSTFFVQLHHPGNEGIPPLCKDGVTVSPSGIVCRSTGAPTRALDTEEVEALVQDFLAAARRAIAAGVDGIEIHGAHGYLVCQFLSPHTNRRTDRYGGSFDGRMRFLTEIINGIRAFAPEGFPLSVRISASEMMETLGEAGQGITVEEGVRIARRLEELGVDLISVSTGTYETGQTVIEPINTPRNWRDPIIRAVREAVTIPVMGTSIIRMPAQAEKMLADGLVDLVAMGRSWLADPAWGAKALAGRDDMIMRCIGCMHCFEVLGQGRHIECAVNPRCGFESEFPESPARDREGSTALVIGGGVAGMEAAEQLAARGASVELHEASDHLGGQVAPGSNPPGKEPMHWLIDAHEQRLRAAGITVRLNSEVTAESAGSFGADVTLVATGARPFAPPLPGVGKEPSVEALDVLNGTAAVGRRVIVVGSGMTGLETAELLHERGHEVLGVFEMANEIAPGAYRRNVESVASHLRAAKIPLNTGHQLREVTPSGAIFEADGNRVNIEADTVVLAIGMRPYNPVSSGLDSAGVQHLVAGDAEKVGKVATAVASGFRAGRSA